jgi:hypothetical protein
MDLWLSVLDGNNDMMNKDNLVYFDDGTVGFVPDELVKPLGLDNRKDGNMDMKVITPLLVDDMTERLVIERQLGTIEDCDERQMVNQAAKCKTMSDINQLLCEYHFLFIHEKNHGRSVVSIAGTQEYVIGLLTERISDDGKIIHNWNLNGDGKEN